MARVGTFKAQSSKSSICEHGRRHAEHEQVARDHRVDAGGLDRVQEPLFVELWLDGPRRVEPGETFGVGVILGGTTRGAGDGGHHGEGHRY